MLILKFWLHISDEEQLKRFKRRDADPLKRWKLTDEDWRNRSKRRRSTRERWRTCSSSTSTKDAPWYLVEANSKRYARVKVLETVCSPRWSARMTENGMEVSPVLEAAM